MRDCCTLSLTSTFGVGWWSRAFHTPATLPAVKGLGTHCAGAELAPGPVWTGGNISPPPGYIPGLSGRKRVSISIEVSAACW